METLLLVVTGVSLVAALFLGWKAWRLTRDEHHRAMARVAALAAAATEPHMAPTPASQTATASTPHDVSTRAELSAFADSRTTWPAPARPRSSPRVAASRPAAAQEIAWEPKADELPLRHEPVSAPVMGDAFLGTASGTTSYGANNGQRLVAVAAFLLLMALGAVGAWIYSTPGSPTSATAAGASTAAPLELISLRHVREGERLSVIGMVRNPASGDPVDGLSAAVLLFDQQGGYLTSMRGQIDVPHLAPGDESPFTVSVQAPAGAARYRVTFRTDERIVPHVDRRGQVPAAAPASAVPATAAAR
jgi:hypothetical protein